jgi:hypothetical protein
VAEARPALTDPPSLAIPDAYRSDGGRVSRPDGGRSPGDGGDGRVGRVGALSSGASPGASCRSLVPDSIHRILAGLIPDAGDPPTLDFGLVSHPSLGLPPLDLTAGYPAAAAAVTAARSRLAARALEVAIAADPTFRDRYRELALRELLADTEALVDRLALALGSHDASVMAAWSDQVAPRYRKRSVPMDDVIGIAEGLRVAAATTVDPDAIPTLNAAIDAAIAPLRWHRRLAGDARKRNPVIAFIYKGA